MEKWMGVINVMICNGFCWKNIPYEYLAQEVGRKNSPRLGAGALDAQGTGKGRERGEG